MTSLNYKIQKVIKEKSKTSGKSTSKYICEKCRDTGWVEGERGVKYCECKIKEIAENQWQVFGVNPNMIKKINDYIVKDERQVKARDIAVEYVNNFEIIRKERCNGLALLGQSGSGKTHLAIAIGAALINKGYKVIYMPYIESISQLKANILDEYAYSKIINKYKIADLVIIDDLFKDKLKNGQVPKERKLNEADIKHLYTVVNYRYINNLPVIVSSEALPDILIELDEAISGRLLERAKGRISTFDKERDNYRLKEWQSS